MNKSESIANLANALSIAQGQMTHAIKNSQNPHFKSTFADLSSVWDAIRKPLSDNGLCVTQTTDGNTLLTVIAHKSGEWIESVTPIFNGKNDAQGFGSGLSYARRYALAAIAGVAQDDDDGNDAQPKHQQQEQKQVVEVTPELEATRRRFHAIGKELYGKNWDAKRHEIIEKETKGKATSTNELNVEWLEYLSNILKKMLNAQLDAAAA